MFVSLDELIMNIVQTEADRSGNLTCKSRRGKDHGETISESIVVRLKQSGLSQSEKEHPL
jgi:hypothetical protein